MFALRTERLHLREMTWDDAEPLAALNGDPEVMRYLGGPIGREASDEYIVRSLESWKRHGFGKFTMADRSTQQFVGWVSLGCGHPALPDDVEIGWRLAARCWGQGLATEGTRAVLAAAFDVLGLDRIVAIADSRNVASIAVMQRLGMGFHSDDMQAYGHDVTIYEVRRVDS
jgi:RimJ/RimL family protein N-acetyltransferase